MLSAREVGLIARRELVRNLRSTKGIALTALFLIGGMVPRVLQTLFQRLTDGTGIHEMSSTAKQQLFRELLEKQYGDAALARYLSGSPVLLYSLFSGTLTFLPLFILVIGFDQLAGEAQHRTLRYTAGRAQRASIVVGKALGIWGVVAVMVLVLHVTVWLFGLAQGESASAILAWGPRFWFLNVVAAAAYVGFTSLMSSLVRTPIVALFAGIGGGFVLWLGYSVLGFFERTKLAVWAFPNNYEHLLMSPDPLRVVSGMALLVGWGALCVAAASVVLARTDV